MGYRLALIIGAGVLIVACSGTQPPIGAPPADAARSRTSSLVIATGSRPHVVEKVLHSFGYGTDGDVPMSNLIDMNGTLYGETYQGGGYGQGGAVFSMSLSGSEKVLYAFKGGASDGANPRGGLIDVGGTLYGTTSQGGMPDCGEHGCGTVFSVSTDGTERVLYRFRPPRRPADGWHPNAGLVAVKGTLYGTTESGGVYGFGNTGGPGTVFRISTDGRTYKVLHNFGLGYDGWLVIAGLTHIKNTLYGTTYYGGRYNGNAGTVFSINTDGTDYTVLHDFGATGDGAYPVSGLTVVNGTLYGTTVSGGAYVHCGAYRYYGCGTVFSISPAGTEKVLHSFGSGSDGINPQGGLIDVHGTLYGTTAYGGSGHCPNYSSGSGCGTVFRLSPSGKEKVIYSFSGPPSDGQTPLTSLLDVNGTLYGTTPNGGAYSRGSCRGNYGCGGIVFALTP